jgi:hypothetical protein
MNVDSSIRHAETLVNLLVDCGPLTRVECCQKLEWSDGRFSTALAVARTDVCPALELAIPQPVPGSGWVYQVTCEWGPVEEGAAHALGGVESRLRSISRDVDIVLPHLTKGTREWRRANFLHKHLTHLLGTLEEINNG